MSPFFDWIDTLCGVDPETRIALKERLHETVAYRRNLKRLIDRNLHQYDLLSTEERAVSEKEDTLRDELEKMK